MMNIFLRKFATSDREHKLGRMSVWRSNFDLTQLHVCTNFEAVNLAKYNFPVGNVCKLQCATSEIHYFCEWNLNEGRPHIASTSRKSYST
jgi:hypothetical protein